MSKQVVLVVDDDKSTRDGLVRALRSGYEVLAAESAERALEILRESTVDVVLSDIRMPGMDGLALLHRVLARTPQPVCILMTAYGSVDRAVEAIKQGADDYVTKPYSLDDVEMRIAKALKTRFMESENKSLHKRLDEKYGLRGIVGESEAMRHVFEVVEQAAPTQATVLIQGESGTGKELIARAIHQLSPRAKGPFVAVHCAALSRNLMESELFGHEKGSFTGADERRLGRFETADGGTLFLDEVSEIDMGTQTKLLRVLEERSFERVGGSKAVDVDIRLIAATNTDLKELMEEGKFRRDLYYRMNVVNIDLPPLRERLDDIPMLCSHFIKEVGRDNGKDVEDLSPEAVAMLSAYAWPGNVRELRNTMEKMVILGRGRRLTARDVPPEIRIVAGDLSGVGPLPGRSDGPMSMHEAEKMMIESALKKQGGNRSKAAEQLGISRRTLYRKLKKYEGEDRK